MRPSNQGDAGEVNGCWGVYDMIESRLGVPKCLAGLIFKSYNEAMRKRVLLNHNLCRHWCWLEDVRLCHVHVHARRRPPEGPTPETSCTPAG